MQLCDKMGKIKAKTVVTRVNNVKDSSGKFVKQNRPKTHVMRLTLTEKQIIENFRRNTVYLPDTPGEKKFNELHQKTCSTCILYDKWQFNVELLELFPTINQV